MLMYLKGLFCTRSFSQFRFYHTMGVLPSTQPVATFGSRFILSSFDVACTARVVYLLVGTILILLIPEVPLCILPVSRYQNGHTCYHWTGVFVDFFMAIAVRSGPWSAGRCLDSWVWYGSVLQALYFIGYYILSSTILKVHYYSLPVFIIIFRSSVMS